MANLQELSDALMSAHAAGDSTNARILADEIERLQGAEQKVPVVAKPVSAVKAFVEPKREGLIGLAQNYGENVGDILYGLPQMPGTVKRLAVGIAGLLPGGASDDPERQAATEMVRSIPGAINTSVNKAYTEATAHPERILGNIGDWAYKHPADITMFAAAPLVKGLERTSTGLRSLEALRAAEGSTKTAGALGAAAKAAEVSAKVVPWSDPMHTLLNAKYVGLKSVVPKIGGQLNRVRGVVNPKDAELMRILGPDAEKLLETLRYKAAHPLEPYAPDVASAPFVTEPVKAGIYPEANIATVSPGPAVGSERGVRPTPPKGGLVGVTRETAPMSGALPEERALVGSERGLALPEENLISSSIENTGLYPEGSVASKAQGPLATLKAKFKKAFTLTPEATENIPYGNVSPFAPYITAGEAVAGTGVEGDILAGIQNVVSGGKNADIVKKYGRNVLERRALRAEIPTKIAGEAEGTANMAKEATDKFGADVYDTARARTAPVNTAPIVAEIDELIAKNPDRRGLVADLNNFKSNLFDADGVLKTNPVNVASIIGDLKDMIGRTKDTFTKQSLSGLKDSFNTVFPEHAEADVLYKKEWAPVHQREIAGYLRDKLVKGGSHVANGGKAFIKAWEDMPGTIKAATGKQYFKSFEPVFEGAEDKLGALKNVYDDLKSEQIYEQALKERHTENAVKDMFGAEEISTPGLFNSSASVARWLIQRSQGKLSRSAAEKIAEQIYSVKTAIPMVEQIVAKQKSAAKIGGASDWATQKAATPAAGVLYQGATQLGRTYDEAMKEALKRKYGVDNDSIPK